MTFNADWGKYDELIVRPGNYSFQLAKKKKEKKNLKILSINSRGFASSARFGGPILRFNPNRGHMMDLFCSGLVHRPGISFHLGEKKIQDSFNQFQRIRELGPDSGGPFPRRPRNTRDCFFFFRLVIQLASK